MLLMLWFCCRLNTAACGILMQCIIWGLKAHRTVSEHILLLQVESSPGQSTQRSKRLTETKRVKQKWWTLQLKCLLLSFASRRNTSHAHSHSLSPSSTRTSFYLSRWNNIEASAFHLTWRKHMVECDARHVACQCNMPATNLITNCHNQGLQSLV